MAVSTAASHLRIHLSTIFTIYLRFGFLQADCIPDPTDVFLYLKVGSSIAIGPGLFTMLPI